MELSTRAPVESDENNQPMQDITNIQVIRGIDGSHITHAAFDTRNTISATGSIKSGSETMTISPKQYFTIEQQNAHFIAFYPAATTLQPGKANFIINGTQDILVTRQPQTAVYNKNGAQICMDFDHLLSWIELKVIAEDAAAIETYGNLTEASVTVPNQVELIIHADGTTSFSKKTDSGQMRLNFGSMNLSVAGNTTNKGYMIYPDESDVTHISLAFEKRSPAELYPVTGLTLTPGTKTVIIAHVKAYGINFQVEVAPWEEGNGNGDDIEIGN